MHVRSCKLVVVTPSPILICADTQQNVVGMSVVGSDFEKLKRFNLDELRQTSPAEVATSTNQIKMSEDKVI